MDTSEQAAISSRNFTHLSDYESWASLYWLHQNGTPAAQLHARSKLREETEELVEALEIGNPDEIISEAGDVLWTSHASGMNADISISESLRTIFPVRFSDVSPRITQLDELALELLAGTPAVQIGQELRGYELQLGKAANQWFNLQEHADVPSDTFANAYIHLKRSRAVHALANTTLLISYVAQEFAGVSLGDVMRENHAKIEGRLLRSEVVTKPPRP